MRLCLVLLAALIAVPAHAIELGEDFGSTEDYGIVHAGGPATASISTFAPYDYPPNSFQVDVRWDGQTADWTDSFTVLCPGSGDAGVDEVGGDEMFYSPKMADQPKTGKMQLLAEVWVRTCQMQPKN